MLPLGVVIPTKNSMPWLARHLESLREWQDLAEQIVVVDSFSTDGTLDCLKANLNHPRASFLSHPPGLYQSWNHGISQISSRYTYISTAGDTITRRGIEELVAAGETLSVDVVISKPVFRGGNGEAVEINWPIDDIVAKLRITSPRKLAKLEAMVFAAAHATGALLGSSASDLYRTETLKRFPFPTDFGTTGDGAWGLLHAAEVSWAIVPEKVSTFQIHPTNASAEEKKSYREARRPDEVLRSTTERWLTQGAVKSADLERMGWGDLLDALTASLEAKIRYDQLRAGRVPWILNLAAWAARADRNRRRAVLEQLQKAALSRISKPE